MTKERLQLLSLEALQDIAGRIGLSRIDGIEKEILIEQILEAFEEDRSDRHNSSNIEMLVKEKKFDLACDEHFGGRNGDEPTLPETYNETIIVVLLRDPYWAFTYWDLNSEDRTRIDSAQEEEEENRLLIRVYEYDSDSSERDSFDIPVRAADRSRYINLPRAGREYSVELLAASEEAEYVLARSNHIHSPDLSLKDYTDFEDDTFMNILAVAGIGELGEDTLQRGIPQRIISLLDAQYLHLQG